MVCILTGKILDATFLPLLFCSRHLVVFQLLKRPPMDAHWVEMNKSQDVAFQYKSGKNVEVRTLINKKKEKLFLRVS